MVKTKFKDLSMFWVCMCVYQVKIDGPWYIGVAIGCGTGDVKAIVNNHGEREQDIAKYELKPYKGCFTYENILTKKEIEKDEPSLVGPAAGI